MRNKLTIAGVSAGVVFAVGLIATMMIPGLGGSSKTKDFTDFYSSDGKRGAATVLGFVLLVGCWLMMWFFTELRHRLGRTNGAELLLRLSAVGAAAIMIGTAVDLGPTMAQNGSDNSEFVGIPIARTFTQAGAGVIIFGLLTFAVAVLLAGFEFRRSLTFPRWLGTASIVCAVLLIGSFFLAPGFLLPIWAVVVAVVARGSVPADSGADLGIAAGAAPAPR